VLYSDGTWWAWLKKRGLLGSTTGVGLQSALRLRFRRDGVLRRTPPLGVLRLLSRRRLQAPVDQDFRGWVAERYGEATADAASNLAGVATFTADPGALSAAFVWERLLRVFAPSPPARYVIGGWNPLVDRLAAHARELGVVIETGARVDDLPEPPVIVATSRAAARQLLGDPSLTEVASGRAVLLDVAVRRSRHDLFVVSDLDAAGWVECYTEPDPTLAPKDESLVQAQMPLGELESRQAAAARLEELVELAIPGWRARTTWRRDATSRGRTGALDLPGRTWRDRPRIDRGGGVFLAGDMVAAPGLLSEVSFHSARAAAAAALGLARERVGVEERR
jgi:phytoene dehydrogenase-like protein